MGVIVLSDLFSMCVWRKVELIDVIIGSLRKKNLSGVVCCLAIEASFGLCLLDATPKSGLSPFLWTVVAMILRSAFSQGNIL